MNLFLCAAGESCGGMARSQLLELLPKLGELRYQVGEFGAQRGELLLELGDFSGIGGGWRGSLTTSGCRGLPAGRWCCSRRLDGSRT